MRDLTEYVLSFDTLSQTVLPPNLAGYLGVYHLEIFLLFLALVVIGPLAGKPRGFLTSNAKKFAFVFQIKNMKAELSLSMLMLLNWYCLFFGFFSLVLLFI